MLTFSKEFLDIPQFDSISVMESQTSQKILCQPINNNMEITWQKTTDVPFPLREGQCACSHGNKMYIFGGIIQNDGEPDNLTESSDLLCFNTSGFFYVNCLTLSQTSPGF